MMVTYLLYYFILLHVSIFGDYFIKQHEKETITKHNILMQLTEVTTTECHLKCSNHETCVSYGTVDYVMVGTVTECFLLEEGREDVGTEETIGLFVVTMEEKMRRITMAKEIVTSTTPATTTKKAPADYVKEIDGHSYNYHTEHVNWATAKAQCESEGAHLAIIDNDVTFSIIGKKVQNPVWLGAFDANQNKKFKWVDGRDVVMKKGDPLYYWKGGQPNNHEGIQSDCMVTTKDFKGRFGDVYCERKYSFFCQRETCPLVDVIYQDHLVKSVKDVPSWDVCRQSCQDANECFAWTYYTNKYGFEPARKQCQFKDETYHKNKGTDSDVISGTKNCTGNTLKYKYDTRNMTWSHAEEECVKWGGHLVSIKSQDENDHIVTELNKRNLNVAWIGLNDLAEEGTFEWVGSDDALGDYTNFRSNKGGGTAQNCVEMIPGEKYGNVWNGKWNDQKCSRENPFICENPLYETTTTD